MQTREELFSLRAGIDSNGVLVSINPERVKQITILDIYLIKVN